LVTLRYIRATKLCASAPYENFTLVCHSEECSDEESAFDFSVLVERMEKAQSSCVFARDIPILLVRLCRGAFFAANKFAQTQMPITLFSTLA
jgi:hypothetical protein